MNRVHRLSVIFFICLLAGSVLAAPQRARIVDFGSKLGTGFYRGYASKSIPAEVDRDGNGTLENDTVWAWPFSLEIPLNGPGLDFDTDAKNAVFYGGLTLYALNNPDRKITEGHPNTNHEMRDDLNFMALAQPRPDERFEGYATWFWQKQDFINGADRYPVSFDDQSFIAVHVSRYWGGVNAGRWLVRDGDRFFLSEATFAGENRIFHLDMDPTNPKLDGASNPITHHTHRLSPHTTRWAEYRPHPPYQIEFNDEKATYTPRAFTNVTAVGFFINRRMSPPVRMAKGLLPHQPMGVKWNAFRCDAVIDRPESASYHADLAPVGEGLFLQRTAVSYALWKRVWRFAVTRQYPQDLGPFGYTFLRDGDMGGMRVDDRPHSAVEPVTSITWWDAVIFCNALSELEGHTPCYYADATFTNVLRAACDRDIAGGMTNQPTVYWKQDADGFRLPTGGEWSRGTKPSEGFWEFVWEGGQPTCMGPEKPTTTVLPIPEKPLLGSPRIGFRIARGPAHKVDGPLHRAWLLTRETVLPPARPLAVETLRQDVGKQLTLVSVARAGLATEPPMLDREFNNVKTPKSDKPYPLSFSRSEISYRLWNDVRNWAEGQGYSFNYAGDMGSMGHATGKHTHQPDEPVTMISLHDAMVWCNALSELLGRQPVYTRDTAGLEIYRNTLPFRLEMFRGQGFPNYAFRTNLPKNWVIHTGANTPVYQHASAHGFRLPWPAEWSMANQSADATRPLDHEWLAGNSQDQTQPVGTKPPNAVGLCDMEGNVAELMWGSTVEAIDNAPKRLGSYFYRDIGSRHPNLDSCEYGAVGRAFVGFRVVTSK
jgi:formylglycine-generating enzyme required for sulfatase activity